MIYDLAESKIPIHLHGQPSQQMTISTAADPVAKKSKIRLSTTDKRLPAIFDRIRIAEAFLLPAVTGRQDFLPQNRDVPEYHGKNFRRGCLSGMKR